MRILNIKTLLLLWLNIDDYQKYYFNRVLSVAKGFLHPEWTVMMVIGLSGVYKNRSCLEYSTSVLVTVVLMTADDTC